MGHSWIPGSLLLSHCQHRILQISVHYSQLSRNLDLLNCFYTILNVDDMSSAFTSVLHWNESHRSLSKPVQSLLTRKCYVLRRRPRALFCGRGSPAHPPPAPLCCPPKTADQRPYVSEEVHTLTLHILVRMWCRRPRSRRPSVTRSFAWGRWLS